MSIVELARRPPQWLRVALASLLLVFVLDSIAHAAHAHDTSVISVVHSATCGYCNTFAAAAPAPVYAHTLPVPALIQLDALASCDVVDTRRVTCVAQARAPPVR